MIDKKKKKISKKKLEVKKSNIKKNINFEVLKQLPPDIIARAIQKKMNEEN